MDIDDILRSSIGKSFRKLVEAQEQYIISFFGSEEEAVKQARFYILEEEMRFIEKEPGVFTIETVYRLRKKTDKELAETT